MKTSCVFLSALAVIATFALASPAIIAEAEAESPLPRVIVEEGTVTTADGTLLRGAACFFDLHDLRDMRENEETYHEYFLSLFKDYPLNCVRICPWIGKWSYDIVGNEHHRTEYLYAIDRYVEWSAEAGIYAIVNLHIEYNTVVDAKKAQAAWDILAPRYRDNSHVIFELLNEPEPKSSFAVTKGLYQQVRKAAPDTHIICFSHVAATQYEPQAFKAASEGIDFSNASVGFHCYDSYLPSTKQWDHAEALRKEGYPMICTEFISLTNNNDMPIEYESVMHCVMRAEDRRLSWIGWGPFAQYRNSNKPGWTHEAIRFDDSFRQQLDAFGVRLGNQQAWLPDGTYQIQCQWGGGYLANSSKEPWKPVKMASETGTATIWNLERIDGNIYRLRSTLGDGIYLQGDFTDDQEWQPVQTADLHEDWGSQKFQLFRVDEDVYRIRCLWGNLYLSGRDVTDTEEPETNVRTAPLEPEWTSQKWRFLPAP